MRALGQNRKRKVWLAVAGLCLAAVVAQQARAEWKWPWSRHHAGGHKGYPVAGLSDCGDTGGSWYWMRSPEQEKRIIVGLYNLHCRRCHAVDGRGVWDIPDVPDLTSASWHAARSEDQLARAILEGRGACMPAFRGTLTLEECWAMARYLRSFVPGSELSKPDTGTPEDGKTKMPAGKTGN